jgi:hypothetical protein
MNGVILEVPSDFAVELIRDELASEAIVWRGADVISLLTLGADFTSAVTAVVVGRKALATVARRLVHRVGAELGDASEEIAVKIVVGGVIEVLGEQNDPDGRARLVARIEVAIEDAGGASQTTLSG